MTLRSISKPFDAGRVIELKYKLDGSGVIDSGELRIRLSPKDAEKFLRGDEWSLTAKRL
jgi:hypothetical protein